MRRLRARIVGGSAATALACGAFLLFGAPSAMAEGAGAVSETQVFHNQVDTFTDFVPCTDVPATITTVSNGAAHVTYLTSGIGAGTFWFTITQTGTVTVVPDDPSLPTYTGHFAFWDGDNGNLQNATETDTLEVRLIGSDGSVINAHLLEHVTVTATGLTFEFDKAVCG
jgi:hypothetical protein